jgi:hypothetical protein
MSSTQKEWLYRLTVVILLGCFILWSVLHSGEFVRNDDEGMNLMKARMWREGYLLHRDIWSDQPPLFTLCLAWAFDLFGESVLVARGTIVAFACLGLVGTAWIARLLGGRISSLAAVIFLAFSPQFLDLSGSVMIGLPAHALATLAMACGLMALRTDREVWLIAAGLTLSASLLTKPLQPFLAVPLAIIVWFQGEASQGTPWHRWGRKLLLLTLATAAPLLVAFCLFGGPLLVQQVAGSYFWHRESHSFRFSRVVPPTVAYVLEGGLLHWTGLFLALHGLVLAWRQRNTRGIAVSVWLLGSLALVWAQTRFRPRYLLFLSFPLAGLLSMGLRDLTCRARLAWTRPRRQWHSLTVGTAAIMCLALGSVGQVRSALAETCCERHPAEEEAVALLRSLCTPGGHVISDDGMLTFRAGLLTPPELTVVSFRRMSTGQLATKTLIAASQAYGPEAIIVWDKRFTDLPGYVDWVSQHYCLAKAWGGSRRIYKACEMLQHSDGLRMQLGDFFGIAGWTLGVSDGNDRVVAPGDTILLTVHWQTIQPTDADYHIFYHLGKETLVAQWDGRPRQGEYPTYRWPQGEEVIDNYSLHVIPNAPPGYYPLWVGMYDWASRDQLPVKDAQGQHIGDTALLTHVRVGRPEVQVPPIPEPQEAKLGDQVRFLGYDLPVEKARPGDRVNLILYWQCLKEMDTSYTVFVHMLDVEGNMVGQWDSIPQSGELPTTTWVPGEVIVDSYEIPVAPEAGPGSCTLEVGMYDAHTGQRLVVTDSDGDRLPGDRILLDDLHLSK